MDTSAWQRLAAKLTERRATLRPEWSERTTFARDTGLSYRSISDLETARRDNYKASWLVKVEKAYEWEPGSIQSVLAGGEPAERGSTPTPLPQKGSSQSASAPEYDGERVGPDDLLHADERLLWRDEARGRRYWLVDKDDASVNVEYLFEPGETPEQVVDDLRDLLAPYRVAVAQMERRRARR